MVIFLLSVPYRGMEKTYVGFYTWLSGLLLIGLAGVEEIFTSFAKGGKSKLSRVGGARMEKNQVST
jgi:hypothetical protein